MTPEGGVGFMLARLAQALSWARGLPVAAQNAAL
jgi:hypothetical protein